MEIAEAEVKEFIKEYETQMMRASLYADVPPILREIDKWLSDNEEKMVAIKQGPFGHLAEHLGDW